MIMMLTKLNIEFEVIITIVYSCHYIKLMHTHNTSVINYMRINLMKLIAFPDPAIPIHRVRLMLY